jgi:ankyrin repeat protein
MRTSILAWVVGCIERLIAAARTLKANDGAEKGTGSPLSSAIRQNRKDMVDLLISTGENVNEEGLLSSAMRVANCDLSILRTLINAGAIVSEQDLDFVLLTRNTDAISLLFHACEVKIFGATALRIAVMRGDLEVMRALIDGGVNVNLIGESGKSALETSIIFVTRLGGDQEVIRMLIQAGAEVGNEQWQSLNKLGIVITDEN